MKDVYQEFTDRANDIKEKREKVFDEALTFFIARGIESGVSNPDEFEVSIAGFNYATFLRKHVKAFEKKTKLTLTEDERLMTIIRKDSQSASLSQPMASPEPSAALRRDGGIF